MRRFIMTPLFAALCGLLIMGLLPIVVHNKYSLFVLSMIAISTILVVGLNLLIGYAGQISLGHAAFFGIGAYTSAILTMEHELAPRFAQLFGATHLQLSPWLAMLVGMLLTSLVALLVGIPCLRLRGHYLAMATLGFGWIVYILMVQLGFTGGSSGIEQIPRLSIGGLVFTSDLSRFYLTWTFAILALLVSAHIVDSRVGRALRALHGSEAAAAILGVDVAKYKVQIFVLSAVYASLAGSLYAHTVNFISPPTFGFIASVGFVVMVVIGGMASVWGAPLGAATITLLVEWLRSVGHHFGRFSEFEVIAHGAVLILVMIFMPAGLTAGIRDLWVRVSRWRRRRAPAPKGEEVALR